MLAGFLLPVSVCFGQALPLEKEQTLNYSYGIGRITWTAPKDLQVGLAVPHWSAGPRIMCAGKRYQCEVQVGPRNITVSDEQRLAQLEDVAKPFLEQATEKTFKPYRHGADKNVVYITLQDPRPAEPFRYLTIGYTHRGPAVIRFEATTNDAMDIVAILNLVDSAKAVDALEMWAYRFADYKAVCEERFPTYKAANDAAFAAGPFARVDVARFFMQRDPSRTEEETRKGLDAARLSYAREFDGLRQEERQSFCEEFPRLIAEAAKDVRTK